MLYYNNIKQTHQNRITTTTQNNEKEEEPKATYKKQLQKQRPTVCTVSNPIDMQVQNIIFEYYIFKGLTGRKAHKNKKMKERKIPGTAL